MSLRPMLLATLDRQRRPRVIPPSKWVWAKAWARRWWHVEAGCAREARVLIELAEGHAVRGERPPGRVLDCNRNARGGPSELPRGHRKEPAAQRARA